MDKRLLECDEELKEQTNGDRYFVLYANETKMKTFRTKKEAKEFIKFIKKDDNTTTKH